jgi:hypothetical protein
MSILREVFGRLNLFTPPNPPTPHHPIVCVSYNLENAASVYLLKIVCVNVRRRLRTCECVTLVSEEKEEWK